MLKMVNQAGDTIIEVMFALTVLALAFSISYATASSALTHATNSQEHTLAMEYMDYQLEALQYLSTTPGSNTTPVFNTTSDFCLQAIKPGAPSQSPIQFSGLFNSPPAFTTQSAGMTEYPAMCQISEGGSEGSLIYFVAIQPDSTVNDDFHVTVNWVGPGNLGVQSEELSYKVYP